jgi:hypothetical protein
MEGSHPDKEKLTILIEAINDDFYQKIDSYDTVLLTRNVHVTLASKEIPLFSIEDILLI